MSSKIRTGTQWLLFGKASAQSVQFVYGIVLARLLVPADFGMIVTIQIFTGIAGFFASGGLAQSLVRSEHIDKIDYQVIFTLQFLICLLIFMGFFLSAPAFASWYGDPLYADLMRLSCVTFLIRPFINTPSSLLHREMRFKETTLIALWTLVVSGATSIIMARNGYGPWSLITGGLVGSSMNVLVYKFITRWEIRIKLDKHIAKKHSGYGIRVSLNNLIAYVTSQAPNFMLSRLFGPAEVGLFNKADSLSGLPMRMIGSAPYAVVFRALAVEQNNIDKSQYIYIKSVVLVMFFTLPVYIGLWWVADPLVVLLYGDIWQETIPLLKILILGGMLGCIGNPSGSVLEARNWVGKEVITKVLSLAILVCVALILLDRASDGIAWAVVVSGTYFLMTTTRLALKSLQIKMSRFLMAIAVPLLLNACLFLVLAGVNAVLVELGHQREFSDISYLIVMTASGAAFYSTAALLVPQVHLYEEPIKIANKFIALTRKYVKNN